jgi:hypothetical protein
MFAAVYLGVDEVGLNEVHMKLLDFMEENLINQGWTAISWRSIGPWDVGWFSLFHRKIHLTPKAKRRG